MNSSKRRRVDPPGSGQQVSQKTHADGSHITHPFLAETTDHCETPDTAYEDIAPILEQLALSMGKTKETLRIYE